MHSLIEFILCAIVKTIGVIVRFLPANMALAFGRIMGTIGYYADVKHKSLAYANLKIAFAKTKKPSEIKKIVKKLFQNFGQNSIELLRLPLIRKQGPEKYIKVEGREHIYEGLKKGKGVIFLAMHFGSWELTTLLTDILGHPYKMLAREQKRFSRLDDLLNSYRQSSGSEVIVRGKGTREIIESLKKNEIVGMVVDQGGRDGSLVKFFGREASMSVGAIRLGLKSGIPICFAVIIRENGPQHRLIIHPALNLENGVSTDQAVTNNLNTIIKMMEGYIKEYPAQYIWFYKIWKYSKESATVIINDGKIGHLRQSQAVAKMIDLALAERGIHSETEIADIHFKNPLAAKGLSFLAFLANANFIQGRLRFFKWFLTRESFRKISRTKADYVVSCGLTGVGINFLLSSDCRAKNIVIFKPGLFGFRKFSLVVLPQHDFKEGDDTKGRVVITRAAPNLINPIYLREQSEALLKRFSHLRTSHRLRVGLLLGGESKNNYISDGQMRTLVGQVKEAVLKLDGEILLTTSRRTPFNLEKIIKQELQDFKLCTLLIMAREENPPEAVGGILGLSDILIVSGDSISMMSEAASSGKNTIGFLAKEKQQLWPSRNKHRIFAQRLHDQNHILLVHEKNIGQTIEDMAKNKIHTQPINDHATIFEAVKQII